ncbi:Uncharacterised protein [Vibrio cholerae]|nr:Uncharacterised protein [Vibrio cholerae]
MASSITRGWCMVFAAHRCGKTRVVRRSYQHQYVTSRPNAGGRPLLLDESRGYAVRPADGG